MRDGFDNDRMVVSASWFAPSDYDLNVDFFNPATGEWENRDCDCQFVNTGEKVTIFGPETGRWRVRLANFLAAPQPVEGTIRFEALPSPGTGPGDFSAKQFERYAANLAKHGGGREPGHHRRCHAGGTTAARTLVRETVTPGSTTHTGTSLGDLRLGQGRVRIAGGLLPDPTEQNHHPFGLFSYALSYTGYQVFENLIDYRRP